MELKKLTCFLSSDLLPWESTSFGRLLSYLAMTHNVRVVTIEKKHQGYLKKHHDLGTVWILSRDWQKALHFLKAGRYPHHLVFSALGSAPSRGLISIFWGKFSSLFPPHATLLTHSPMNFRYYREFGEISKNSVKYLPLPALRIDSNLVQKPHDELLVGCMAPFITSSNLPFFLNVAHKVIRNHATVRFCLYGKGPLYRHLQTLCEKMGLSERVIIREVLSFEDINLFDIFCYTALQNQHFLTLLAAASLKKPTLCCEIAGAEDFFLGETSQIVFPVNDVESYANRILELLSDEPKRLQLGEELFSHVEQKFAIEKVGAGFEELLFDEPMAVTEAEVKIAIP